LRFPLSSLSAVSFWSVEASTPPRNTRAGLALPPRDLRRLHRWLDPPRLRHT
jgi:hypothetical protein